MKNLSVSLVARAACAVLVSLAAAQASAGLITPFSATVSSTDFSARASVYAISGAGLTPNASVATGFVHGIGAGNQMWNTVGRGQDNNPFIQFDLGDVYDIAQAYIWNFNENFGGVCCTGFGMKTVEVTAGATTSSMKWIGSYEFQRATGLADYAGEIIDMPMDDVRYIRFTPRNTWSGTIFGPNYSTPPVAEGRGITGLSEVRFKEASTAQVPVPGTLALVAAAAMGALALRRRRSA